MPKAQKLADTLVAEYDRKVLLKLIPLLQERLFITPDDYLKSEIEFENGTVTKIKGSTDYRREYYKAIMFKSATKFKVTLKQNCDYLLIGVVINGFFTSQQENYHHGFYLNTHTGGLRSRNNPYDEKEYAEPCYQYGTEIEVHLDNEKHELKFIINGKDMGVAYTDLPDMELRPAFDILLGHTSFEVEKL